MPINLVEHKTKLFFNSELNRISKKNFKRNSSIINISIFIVFSMFIGGILYYRYNNKPKKKHKVNDNKVRKYLLDKINSDEKSIKIRAKK